MQYNLGTIDPNTTSGTLLAQRLTFWKDAVNSMHSGVGRPGYAVQGTLWVDVSNPARHILYYFNGSYDTPVIAFYPGTGFTETVNSGAYGWRNWIAYASSLTYFPTSPQVKIVRLRGVAGGGGGGAAVGGAGEASAGGGGGGGGFAETYVSMVGVPWLSLFIGAAGIGGVPNGAGATQGGVTQINSPSGVVLQAIGGGAGGPTVSTQYDAVGGRGGGAGYGSIGGYGITGQPGESGLRFGQLAGVTATPNAAKGGAGGHSALGGGAPSTLGGEFGIQAGGWGGGGSGGALVTSGGRNGGNGYPGLIILEEFGT